VLGIKQCRVSNILTFFATRFMTKYGLVPYNDPNRPALFFGCYRYGSGKSDIPIILKHRSLAVVVFGGTDSLQLSERPQLYRELWRRPNVRFVAISGYVARDLDKVGVPYKLLPMCPASPKDFHPVPLGPEVYAYSAHGRPGFYGEPIIDRLIRKLPDTGFNVCYAEPPGNVPADKIAEVYNRCFIGLRLTPHDGLPNTVIELGMMGRRCIWNGGLPNAIPWSSEKDLIRIIIEEKAKVGNTNQKLSKKVKVYLEIGEEWKSSNYWGYV